MTVSLLVSISLRQVKARSPSLLTDIFTTVSIVSAANGSSEDEEALFRPFRKDVENPWESKTGYVDTRVDGQGKLINPQVREYVKRHRLTYPESVAMGGRPPFGRYWDEKKD